MNKYKKILYVILSLIGLVVFFWCALPIGVGMMHIGIIIPMISGIVLTLYCLLSIKYPKEKIPYKEDQDISYKTEMEIARHRAANERGKMRSTILFGSKRVNLEEYDENYENENKVGLVFSREARNAIDRVFIVIIILAIIITAIGTSMILGYDKFKDDYQGETVLILGCKVNGDKPSTVLKKRLDKGIEILEKYPEAKCIVSGGKGYDETIPEGTVMKNYLIENGIDENRIFEETKSRDTKENFAFSEKIADENNLNKNFIVITQEFHQNRAEDIAKAQGIQTKGAVAKTEGYMWLSYWFREIFANIANIFM